MTLVWVQDYGVARRQVDAWLSFSGQAGIGLGLWLVAVGIFVMALGTVWMALRGPLEWADYECEPQPAWISASRST